MFTVLSNTRNSSLYLIAALAVMLVVVLTFTAAPAISAPEPVLVPVTGISEGGSDYYQRHPELRASAAIVANTTADFYQRHPEWTSNIQIAAIPVTGSAEASDYFQRHPELSAPAGNAVDMTDYFIRHSELRMPTNSNDLSDYFLRH